MFGMVFFALLCHRSPLELLRTRAVTIAKEILDSLSKAQSYSLRLTPEELLQALEPLYFTEGHGSQVPPRPAQEFPAQRPHTPHLLQSAREE
jgi:hypothetical protein